MHEHTFECLFLYFEFVLLNYKKEKYSDKKCHKDQDNNYGKLNAWILNILLTSHFCFLFRFFVLGQPQALLLMLTFRVNWNEEHNGAFKEKLQTQNLLSQIQYIFKTHAAISQNKMFPNNLTPFLTDAAPAPNCCICSPPSSSQTLSSPLASVAAWSDPVVPAGIKLLTIGAGPLPRDLKMENL